MDSTDACQFPHQISHYVDQLSHKPQYVDKFGLYSYETRSVLKNLTADVDPCLIIEKYIQSLLENAVATARQNGHSPYWYGVTLCAEGGNDFLVNWKPEDVNHAGRLSCEIKKFHQSAQCLNIAERPITVRITVVADPRTVL
ncbi:hypothetical protein AAVH_31652 [Aphelenchoides avenae]|nr:hypothetical protein AAVH_41938 [Aphelenchus avenae]KAH7701219.1 hypothetical protein AAVH_31652 [Aphelenchus avenae]